MTVYLLIEERNSIISKSSLHQIEIAVTSEEQAMIWKNEDPRHRNYKKILVVDVSTEEELERYLSVINYGMVN